MFLFLASLVILVFLLSWGATYGSRWLAHRTGAIDQAVGGRKIHTRATPLLGGWGIGAVIILFILLGMQLGWFEARDLRSAQLIGFLIGILILLIGGFLDDRYALSPKIQILFPVMAALSVIFGGTTIIQLTNPGGGALSLLWQHVTWQIGGKTFSLSFPADALSFVWLLAVTYATKFLDGLDGLVSGQTVIGAGLIAALALSAAFYQPHVAILALIVGAAFAGFLPTNLHPAKQFLGESGSTIAGFSLGFLAIVAGTKVATAFMALGLPLADASLVILGRLLHGASPFRGDDTHLHFKLLKSGLSQRAVVILLWSISLFFGITALGLQTKGKILLIIALLALTFFLSYFAALRQRANKKSV
ncbi:MAG: MraY family glycosyltransferase [bacterium]|nr:MraY family glycosyltransferase [bacterium]